MLVRQGFYLPPPIPAPVFYAPSMTMPPYQNLAPQQAAQTTNVMGIQSTPLPTNLLLNSAYPPTVVATIALGNGESSPSRSDSSLGSSASPLRNYRRRKKKKQKRNKQISNTLPSMAVPAMPILPPQFMQPIAQYTSPPYNISPNFLRRLHRQPR